MKQATAKGTGGQSNRNRQSHYQRQTLFQGCNVSAAIKTKQTKPTRAGKTATDKSTENHYQRANTVSGCNQTDGTKSIQATFLHLIFKSPFSVLLLLRLPQY
jgi:hypothetical protein